MRFLIETVALVLLFVLFVQVVMKVIGFFIDRRAAAEDRERLMEKELREALNSEKPEKALEDWIVVYGHEANREMLARVTQRKDGFYVQ